MCLDGLLSHDGCFAVWADRDDLDRNAEEVLHEGDIVAEFLRKFLLSAAMCEVCVPALEFGIYRLDVCVCVEWPLVRRLSVHNVGCADLDGLECVEAV